MRFKNGKESMLIWKMRMKNEMNKLGEEITGLKHVNKDLAAYVEALEQKETLKCKGKKLNQIGAKQVGRKLLHLKNQGPVCLMVL